MGDRMAMPDDNLPEPVSVPFVWVGFNDDVIRTASIFSSQIYAENEIILTIGQVTPPLILGNPQAGAGSFAQVRTLGKFGLTVSRAEKLIEVLQKTIRGHTGLIERGDV